MRTEVEFSSRGVTLRGWLYRPDRQVSQGDQSDREGDAPLVVMAHGFAGVKEMAAPFAEVFVQAGLACLLYDHPGFGTSDGEPRQEVDPLAQIEGYRDAITYAEGLDGINGDRIAVWGTSYAGGEVLIVAATDRRARAVVSQVPVTQGAATFARLVSSVMMPTMHHVIAEDRRARAAGKPSLTIPLSTDDPTQMAAMPGPEVHRWNRQNGPQIESWRDEVTISSVDKMQSFVPEAFISRVSPTPLLMVVADQDTLTPTDLALQSYSQALEPKRLELVHGGHFSVYEEGFEQASSAARDFLVDQLLDGRA